MFSLQYNLPLPTKPCTKEDFYKIVSSDRVKNKITEFRKLKAEGNDKEADAKKRSLPIFIYQATFEESESKNGSKACWRKQEAAHLNGLVMLDIDHVDNPLEVFEAWKKNDELVKRTALVHITSSKKGIRFVFTANIKDGNLADNQIVFAQALGYPSDSSCIDATRNSFAPKEEDILYMNENLLFDYYDEKYDKKFTAGYRDKNTQPLYHQFPTVGGDNPSIPVPTAALASKDGQQGTKISDSLDVHQGSTC